VKRLIGLAAFQVVVLLGWAGQNELVRATAPTFRIPLRPRDPHDVLRGRYFVLNPLDSSIKTGDQGVALTAEEVKRFLGSDTSFRGPARVGFCPQEEHYRICAIARRGEALAGGSAQHWSRADVSVQWEESTWRAGKQIHDPGYRLDIDLALDRFFLPNRVTLPAPESDLGWELEACHRPGLSPLPKRLLFRGQQLLAD